MILKLKNGFVPFLNKQILAVDTKRVTLDRVMTNLFMLIYADGAPVRLKKSNGFTVESIMQDIVPHLEEEGRMVGAMEHPDAIEDWLRSSLLNFVNRGNMLKENIASLSPFHLLSYRIQNKKYCRDYLTSDQLYLMLRTSPDVLDGLRRYLGVGCDFKKKGIVPADVSDVDTAGVLQLTSRLHETLSTNTTLNTIEPLLKGQTALFTDDVRRLLAYKDVLPRMVFIDYFRILCGMHLALYTMKVIHLLPKMVAACTTEVEDDWSLTVDLTDNLESRFSHIACQDMERVLNECRSYVRATYTINIVAQKCIADRDAPIKDVLETLKKGICQDGIKGELLKIRNEGLKDKNDKEFDQADFDDLLFYYDKDDYLGKYVHVLESSNLGCSQYRYLREFLDAVAMKNSPSKLMADGRSRRHPRRGAMGSKLLETLVQILVLRPNPDGKTYQSRSLSIDELAQAIRHRYGLIINGSTEPRFANADVGAHAAFAENMEAFRSKLRHTGFYTDLSDSSILQKIRPRYKL